MLRSAHCQFPDWPLQLGAGLGLSLQWQPAGQIPWGGGGLGRCGAAWDQFIPVGGCPMLAAREEVASPPSLLSLEGLWFRLPPHLHGMNGLFPPGGIAASSPHRSAVLTNTVFHTVFPPPIPPDLSPLPVPHGL